MMSIEVTIHLGRFSKCERAGMQWRGPSAKKKDRERSQVKGQEHKENDNWIEQKPCTSLEKAQDVTTELNEKKEQHKEKISFEDFSIILTTGNGTKQRVTSETTYIKIKHFLEGSYIPPSWDNYNCRPTLLESLSNAFANLLNQSYPTSPIYVTEILSLKKYVSYCERCAMLLGEALMYSPEFCAFSVGDRKLIFKVFHPIFLTLERIYTSIQYYGIMDKRKILLFGDDIAYDTKVTGVNDCILEEADRNLFIRLAGPINAFLINTLYQPLKELQATSVMEFTYLMASSLFSTDEIPEISEDGKAKGFAFKKSLNNQIHDYYASLGIDNYAFKLTQMIKISTRCRKFCAMKNEMIVTAKIFKIINLFPNEKVAGDVSRNSF
uniref:NR LBD domain-containing protein n=1 Tax=Rhabditophanes sp. KR3021 TaxID=114890 RepID=A0AC35UB25_9BILA